MGDRFVRGTAFGVALLALLVAHLAGVGLGAASQTPSTASPVAEPRTVGELADRVTAAWAGVRTYRAVRTFAVVDADATPAALSTPEAGITEIVEEAVLPDRVRQTVSVDGLTSEAVAVAGRLYARGELSAFPRPSGDAETWVLVDPAALDPSSQLGVLYAGLTAPVAVPFAALPPGARALELQPLGARQVADRECRAYRFATSEADERFETVIAIGPDDLPCSVEIRFRDVVTIVTYLAYNEPITIEPPTAFVPAATPAGGD